MANTSFCGKNGRVYWDSGSSVRLGNVVSWSVNVTVDTNDANCMGEDDDWTRRRAAFKDWSATVEMYLSSDGPNIDLDDLGKLDDGQAEPSPCTLELWFGSTKAAGYLSGAAVCTSLDTDMPADNIARLRARFQGNGALNFATA